MGQSVAVEDEGTISGALDAIVRLSTTCPMSGETQYFFNLIFIGRPYFATYYRASSQKVCFVPILSVPSSDPAF